MKISIYTINDEPIGCGGMGQVYLGTDPNGNRMAIKEMRAEFVADSNLRARFHQEVTILSRLEHRSIVKLYASFEERGNLYLAMEYVEGETIDQYIKRTGAMDESKAVGILLDVLAALGYAHQNGYVHRDIKPSNIMIRTNGKVCLLDFGIAKDMNRNGGLTVGQLTIGTDGYMSPEQAEGLSIDQRSDIYSLGCVFFYMLTGHHAIQKQENDYATRMTIIQSNFPKAKDFNPQISDNIQRILDKATDKNMLMRFQSCREFEMEMNSGKTIITDPSDNIIISIGREGCDIVIPHPKISRHHLDVIREKTSTGKLYRFRDRSTNGTVINEKKIHNNEITCFIHYENQNGIYRTDDFPTILLAGEINVDWIRIEEVFGKKQSDTKPQPLSVIQPPVLTPPPEPPSFTPKSATEWLIAIYIFAILGGLLGLAFGISIFSSKVEFANGQKIYKYKDTHRNAALAGAILSCISMFLWKLAFN